MPPGAEIHCQPALIRAAHHLACAALVPEEAVQFGDGDAYCFLYLYQHRTTDLEAPFTYPVQQASLYPESR